MVIFLMSSAFCQEEAEQKEKDKPVRDPWSSGILIDQQTSFIPAAKTFESVIQHRFGSIQSSMTDVYGIFSPGANLRLGFNYVIFKNVQIGYGLTKGQMYNDFNLKWTVFEQTRENTVPVSVMLNGNFAISGNADDAYALDYSFGNRLSSFAQIVIGRKVSDAISLQTGASFTHYNWVDTGLDHDFIAAHVGGRIKVSPQSSILFNVDVPLEIEIISEQREFINHPLPNVSVGYEVSTGMHSFQVFIATANGIVPQDIAAKNHNNWKNGGFHVGFMMNRLWGF